MKVWTKRSRLAKSLEQEVGMCANVQSHARVYPKSLGIENQTIHVVEVNHNKNLGNLGLTWSAIWPQTLTQLDTEVFVPLEATTAVHGGRRVLVRRAWVLEGCQQTRCVGVQKPQSVGGC